MNPLLTPKDAIEIGLILTRVIAIFLSFPLLNTSMVPINIKILLVLMLSFYISTFTNMSIDMVNFSVLNLLFLIIKELFIGFSLGLLVNIFISAFSYAAEIISYFMGLTVVNVFDPTFGQISVLNRFFILLFYLIFFITDAYHYILGSLIMSFEYFPLDKLIINENIWQFIIEKSSYIFILGIQIAFPFALILFLINVALALVNRLIPQINVFIVGLPMQIFVGLASLAFGASVIIYTIVTLIQRLGEDYIGFVKMLGF
ncbi:flagellar biosynthetic protein FliR [Nitrosophilus kaiyonis]|uniref:flagellar biosynthetic protein FliR n=1 Tax=Nitrosophilus kaiyonis TaxID=2930200 RepID=UPI002490F312|nr:flagellar biosynthetic protein FliR [Nitrosophilus kaiyonis]